MDGFRAPVFSGQLFLYTTYYVIESICFSVFVGVYGPVYGKDRKPYSKRADTVYGLHLLIKKSKDRTPPFTVYGLWNVLVNAKKSAAIAKTCYNWDSHKSSIDRRIRSCLCICSIKKL